MSWALVVLAVVGASLGSALGTAFVVRAMVRAVIRDELQGFAERLAAAEAMLEFIAHMLGLKWRRPNPAD